MSDYDDQSGPERRRPLVDAPVRTTFLMAGVDPTSPSSRERFAEGWEWVRFRFSHRGEIVKRDEYVDKLMEDEEGRTKRRTQVIIWIFSVVGTAAAAFETGLVQKIVDHLVPGK